MKTTKKTIEVTKNDNGVIVNKETGKPHFTELLRKKIKRYNYIFKFWKFSYLTLKKQIKNQGFKISNEFIESAEDIRFELHCLNKSGILKEKELRKSFKRLNKMICKQIISLELKDGETAMHKETIIN